MSSNFSVINITDQWIAGSIIISMEMLVQVKMLISIDNHNIRYVHCNQQYFPPTSSGGFWIKINIATKYVRKQPFFKMNRLYDISTIFTHLIGNYITN